MDALRGDVHGLNDLLFCGMLPCVHLVLPDPTLLTDPQPTHTNLFYLLLPIVAHSNSSLHNLSLVPLYNLYLTYIHSCIITYACSCISLPYGCLRIY